MDAIKPHTIMRSSIGRKDNWYLCLAGASRQPTDHQCFVRCVHDYRCWAFLPVVSPLHSVRIHHLTCTPFPPGIAISLSSYHMVFTLPFMPPHFWLLHNVFNLKHPESLCMGRWSSPAMMLLLLEHRRLIPHWQCGDRWFVGLHFGSPAKKSGATHHFF